MAVAVVGQVVLQKELPAELVAAVASELPLVLDRSVTQHHADQHFISIINVRTSVRS